MSHYQSSPEHPGKAAEPGSLAGCGSTHQSAAGLTGTVSRQISGPGSQTDCPCWEGTGQMLWLVGRPVSTQRAPLPVAGSPQTEPVPSCAAPPPGQEGKDRTD